MLLSACETNATISEDVVETKTNVHAHVFIETVCIHRGDCVHQCVVFIGIPAVCIHLPIVHSSGRCVHAMVIIFIKFDIFIGWCIHRDMVYSPGAASTLYLLCSSSIFLVSVLHPFRLA